jgi:hypothetical protein
MSWLYPNVQVSEYSLCFLQDEEVIGGQILEALLQAGWPAELNTVCFSGTA